MACRKHAAAAANKRTSQKRYTHKMHHAYVQMKYGYKERVTCDTTVHCWNITRLRAPMYVVQFTIVASCHYQDFITHFDMVWREMFAKKSYKDICLTDFPSGKLLKLFTAWLFIACDNNIASIIQQKYINVRNETSVEGCVEIFTHWKHARY